MEIRIGIVQTARELAIEIEDEQARAAFRASLESALAGGAKVVSVVDSKGREIVLPAEKIAYVEFGAPSGTRRLGFGG
jgi:hypothetical protein